MDNLLPLAFGGETLRRPIIIAGPCSAETREQVLGTARGLAAEGVGIFRAGIWKPRTKPGGFEGVGATGLSWLAQVRRETGMKTATEVATRAHVRAALGHGVDMLWIGARTSANPFAVQEIADTLRESGRDIPVLVKNPVNPDLELWAGALMRLYNAGVRRLGAIHRGFSTFGEHLYRNSPCWSIPLELRVRYPHLPIICDPSHIGGRRDLIAPLAQHTLDIGFDGLIIESHCSPDCAWSDAAQQVTPRRLGEILRSLVCRDTLLPEGKLDLLRSEIDRLDSELLDILARRMEVSRRIGAYKRERNMPVVQPDRYGDVMASRVETARGLGLGEAFMRKLLAAIHEESVRIQVEHGEGDTSSGLQ